MKRSTVGNENSLDLAKLVRRLAKHNRSLVCASKPPNVILCLLLISRSDVWKEVGWFERRTLPPRNNDTTRR